MITTLPNDKSNSASSKKSKPKQATVKEPHACKEEASVRSTADRTPAKSSKISLESLRLVLSALKSKFSIIGKEKFYALFYLFLFFTLCYLFAIICYNSL